MPSTAISAAHYDIERKLLDIVFITGRRYHYYEVPPGEAEAFARARSKGAFFNTRIRDRYDFAEVAG